ncbi:TetR/AcrR family transcriptional regulator [Celerinatantimonas diazotrophica]|uniref:TetR family transcriptional regulator n=1 Tax=Celerinatantimonas diazotrophica TaxID=412034 RepID=A0A4R1K1C7_9GAMM|nr:CerR family C-terminal domain-containing protein [Celerinatantimonas diazotrophica]TCK57690.1 TetR family transcriptional regulator [Celerinatantimonas diazotrophica]CAG9298248.1 hypothetical protein CEDIAZO_03443 [Celerinatantimonas diazotrophica]
MEPKRKRRPDGDKTREQIIEAAGELFAQYGYQGTTSKAICQRCGVNLASVNYHFGSRQGLYKVILRQVHESFMDLEHLDALMDSELEAEAKFHTFIGALIPAILGAKNWQLRIWAREIAAPSEFLSYVVNEQILPKFTRLNTLISQLTGLAEDDPRLLPAIFNVLAPCLMMLIANREQQMPLSGIFNYPSEQLVDHLQRFLLAGLRAVSENDSG